MFAKSAVSYIAVLTTGIILGNILTRYRYKRLGLLKKEEEDIYAEFLNILNKLTSAGFQSQAQDLFSSWVNIFPN